jgi:hypothetical protein
MVVVARRDGDVVAAAAVAQVADGEDAVVDGEDTALGESVHRHTRGCLCFFVGAGK